MCSNFHFDGTFTAPLRICYELSWYEGIMIFFSDKSNAVLTFPAWAHMLYLSVCDESLDIENPTQNRHDTWPTVQGFLLDPISQISRCTFPISHNTPFRTEICTSLFWICTFMFLMVDYGIWDQGIVGFVILFYTNDKIRSQLHLCPDSWTVVACA